MPLRYLRRPLFWVLVIYMSSLAALSRWGFFRLPFPREGRDWVRASEVRLAGIVVSPRRQDLRGVKLVLSGAAIEGRPLGSKVIAYLRPEAVSDAIRPGLRLAVLGRLRRPRLPRNPGDFDERAFLSDRGIGWALHARVVEILPSPVPALTRPVFWAEGARLSVQRAFEKWLDPVDSKLMTGFCLGYKGSLPRELNRAIQDAGAIHLLVPSGAKVAFVLLAVAFIAARFSCPVWLRLLAAALSGGFYVLMVGAEPPYARAYLGAMALGLGFWRDRESGAFQATVLSALLILLAEPRALFSAGFQMTYAAMAGLLVAMPQVNAALPGNWPKTLRGLLCVLSVTFIVQLILWPIFANLFGRAAFLGASANLPLVPFSGVILASGFAFWGLSFVGPGFILHRAAQCLELLLAIFRWTCFKAASLPWAAVELSPMTASEIAAYYLCAAALLVLPRRTAARFSTAPLRVVYLSLPKHSVAVAFLHGQTWLIGPESPTAPVRKALKALRVRHLDRTVDITDNPGFSVCEGEVCLLFDPPRVRRGSEEFSIIEPRLARSAVEASTDGTRIEVKSAVAGAFH
ncbi:MAG: ComEC/Rec2 family competence protein [Elusimicrobia bacterium]|nr:ComEC/Rec2 family competence protein [Elusimicrobiota bacterium]